MTKDKIKVSQRVPEPANELKQNKVYHGQNHVVNAITHQTSDNPITSQEYWDKLLDTKTVIAGVDIVDIEKSNLR